MTAPWWMVGGIGLLGGVVGGGVVGVVVGGASGPESPAPARASEPEGRGAENPIGATPGNQDADESETDERVRRLEHRVALLIAALQERDGTALEDEDGRDSPGIDDARESATDVADPVFEAAVLDIFDRERERREEERATWRKELHVERGKRYAGELREVLGLSEDQQTELAMVVAEFFDKWRALRDDESADRPATRSEWRARAERMNASLDEKLATVLRPEQLQKYQALDPDQKLGGFGRGRRDQQRDRAAGQ